MRINKYLALAGLGSRRKVEELVTMGKIKVNGKVTKDLSTDIKDTDIVYFGSKAVKVNNNFVYYKLHKPKGYVTTVDDDKERKTVMDLLRGVHTRVYPVGRLDYDTEGLIFLTTNGKFSNFIASPQTQIQKTYFVTLQNQVSPSQKQKYTELLEEGIFLQAENKSPAFTTKKATLIWKSDTECELTIQEGKFHQVKRMFAALGNSVAKLKRIKIGNIELDKTLLPGEFRVLTLQELNSFIQN